MPPRAEEPRPAGPRAERQRGTRHRALLALVVVGLSLPPLLVSWFELQRERALVRSANVNLLAARVDEVGHTLEAMYGGYQSEASRSARDPAIVAFCAGSPESRLRNQASLDERLDVFRGDAPAVRGLAVLDLNGTIIAATERPLLGKAFDHRPEFQSAVAGWAAASEVFISAPETGRIPSVVFAAPVRTKGGVVVGVYWLAVRAEALWTVLRDANDSAGKGSFFALFDEYGIRVGDGRNEKLLFHPSVPLSQEDAQAMLTGRRFQERTAELISAVVPFPFDEIQTAERRVFTRSRSPTNNVSNLAASRRFPMIQGTIVAHVPASEVEVGVLSVLPRVLPGFAVGIVLALVVSVLLIKLRRSNDVLENTFEYMDQGISITDRRQKVIGTNRRFRELLRFPESFYQPGTPFEEFVRYNARRGEYGPGDVETQVKERVEKERDSGSQHYQRQRPDGSIIEVSGHPVPGMGAVRIITDVTARVRAEQALRESQDVFRSLTELSSDWYWEQDENLRFISVSAPAQAKADAPPESALGKALWESPETTPVSGSWDALKAVMSERKTFRDFECRYTNPRGEIVHVSLSGLPVFTEDGRFRGYRGTTRDVTGKKRSEELARALAASEEEKRLEMQRAEAEKQSLLEASRMKSVFLATMSHELRTPLNAILGFTDLVQSGEAGPISPQQHDFLEQALGSGRHLLQLINEVLDLTRIESGRLDLHPEPVDLAALVVEVISNLKAAAESGHVRTFVELDETIQSVVVDPARLKQVLYNYLSNALKFTPADGTVVVRTRPDGTNRFILEVEDTGVGIAPADLERLFVEFQQLDSGHARKHGGTGLGLALTKRLVEAQGGTVGVRSTQGKGSVFYAVLPRTPLDAASAS